MEVLKSKNQSLRDEIVLLKAKITNLKIPLERENRRELQRSPLNIDKMYRSISKIQ